MSVSADGERYSLSPEQQFNHIGFANVAHLERVARPKHRVSMPVADMVPDDLPTQAFIEGYLSGQEPDLWEYSGDEMALPGEDDSRTDEWELSLQLFRLTGTMAGGTTVWSNRTPLASNLLTCSFHGIRRYLVGNPHTFPERVNLLALKPYGHLATLSDVTSDGVLGESWLAGYVEGITPHGLELDDGRYVKPESESSIYWKKRQKLGRQFRRNCRWNPI